MKNHLRQIQVVPEKVIAVNLIFPQQACSGNVHIQYARALAVGQQLKHCHCML